MKLSEKQRKFTLMVADLILFVYSRNRKYDYSLTFGETYRTIEQQTIYFLNGKSKVKYSKHQDRLAIDLNVFKDGEYTADPADYRWIGEEWEKMGGRWGGSFDTFKDYNHFEWKDITIN